MIRLLAAAALTFAFALTAHPSLAETPTVRCQLFEAPLPGFNYRTAVTTRDARVPPSGRHIITTTTENGRHHWLGTNYRGSSASSTLYGVAIDLEIAHRNWEAELPEITNAGLTEQELEALNLPAGLDTFATICDRAIRDTLTFLRGEGHAFSRENAITQIDIAAQGGRAARTTSEAELRSRNQKKSSSSGGTIAAIGGAALVAGGLTWLLWPDAKSTIQPWTEGRNDGYGYSAGMQMKLGPKASFRLYQQGIDGPREHRSTHIGLDLRW